MKKTIASAWKFAAVCGVTLALGLSTAQAFQIDTLIKAVDMPKSGLAFELAALKAYSMDPSLQFIARFDQEDGFSVALNEDKAGEFVIDASNFAASHFVLKFGDGGVAASIPDTYFFKNIGEAGKPVFTSSHVNDLFSCQTTKANCDFGRLSHFTLYGAQDGKVQSAAAPEPATLALVCLGILGFAASRRKARSKQA